MKDAVDPQLQEQQAGFCRGRSSTGQIATLRIILEQSSKWNSPIYVNFIDYKKAFDSLDRQRLETAETLSGTGEDHQHC